MRLYLIVGVLAFMAIASPGNSAAEQATAASTTQPATEIEIAAGRFSFAPDAIEVQKGERVRLIVRSVDVAHGISIPLAADSAADSHKRRAGRH